MRSEVAPRQEDIPVIPSERQNIRPLWSPEQFGNETQSRSLFRAAHAKFLSLFVVASSSGDSLAYLDGIRGVAVTLVVLLHAWILSGTPTVMTTVPLLGTTINLTPFLSTGYVGVDLFFVLSGFLLSQYWLKADFGDKPRPSTRRYFRHRFFRIVPGYYFCLFLMLIFLVPFLIPAELVYSQTGAFILGAHLLFLQYIFPLSAASYSINGPLWTLTMEMIFYIVLPWAVVLFFRNRWLVTMPILTALTLIWLYLCRHSMYPLVHMLQGTVARYGVDDKTIRYFLSKQFPAHFVDFGLGMTLANILVRMQMRPGESRALRVGTHPWMGKVYFVVGWIIVLAAMRAIATSTAPSAYYFSEIPVAFGFTFVLAGLLFGGSLVQHTFGFTQLRLIGLVGFSAYLWHMPIINLLVKHPTVIAMTPEGRFPYVLTRATVIVALISMAFFLMIEKPFLILGRGHGTTKAAPASTSIGESVGAPVAVHHADG